MAQTLSHTAVFQASEDDLWEACKIVGTINCELWPWEPFVKVEFLEEHGKPGSICFITTGPAIKHKGFLKECLDKFDDVTETLAYTELEGDSRCSAFSAEIQFVAKDAAVTEATWTTTFVPVGDMGPPDHIKAVAELVFRALDKVVHVKKTFAHTETLDVSPDALWNAFKHADEILLEQMPQHFEWIAKVEDDEEPGTMRIVQFGPAVQFADTLTTRMNFIDPETRRMGYTVVKGDPRYKYFAVTMQFSPGPSASSTSGLWVATYVPEGDMGPPEHIRDLEMSVWKTLAAAAKANADRYA